MLIDSYEQYNQHENDMVEISPDDGSDEQPEQQLRADDRMFLVAYRILY